MTLQAIEPADRWTRAVEVETYGNYMYLFLDGEENSVELTPAEARSLAAYLIVAASEVEEDPYDR